MDNNYEDIINLPHHISKKYNQMSLYDRAAQFSSFAALVGHDDAIKETERLTERKIELSCDEKEILNNKLQLIVENINEQKHIKITYFIKDKRKPGGKYVSTECVIKKYDEISKKFILNNNDEIYVNDIYDIEV